MTNPYFSSYTALPRNQLARCEAVNAIFDAIIAGFDLIPDLSAFQKGTNTFCVDTGTANAYVITPPNALGAYGVGQSFSFIALHTNTGASTANNSALGVRAIKRLDGADLNPGDILAGQVVEIRDDGTHYQITSPAGSDEAAAAVSATAAAASASAASTSASSASTSATASAASASAASASASAAATSATNSASSATAAAASATSITSYLTFAAGPKVGIGVAPGGFTLNVNGTTNLGGNITGTGMAHSSTDQAMGVKSGSTTVVAGANIAIATPTGTCGMLIVNCQHSLGSSAKEIFYDNNAGFVGVQVMGAAVSSGAEEFGAVTGDAGGGNTVNIATNSGGQGTMTIHWKTIPTAR
jgi:hypothetical protein